MKLCSLCEGLFVREAVWREGGKGAGGRQDGELELGPHKDESQKDAVGRWWIGPP